jgi:hypothetical protein
LAWPPLMSSLRVVRRANCCVELGQGRHALSGLLETRGRAGVWPDSV